MTLMEMEAKSVETFHVIIEKSFYRSEAYFPTRSASQHFFRLISSTAGPISVAKYSGGDLGVRRNWTHIRSLSSEQYVIWFPVQGRLSITQDAHQNESVGLDNFIITCGDRPFHALADSGPSKIGQCSQLLVQVPSHIMRTHLPNVNQICGRRFSAHRGAARIAREIFCGLVDDAHFMPEAAATDFSLCGLKSLVDSIGRELPSELINANTKNAQFNQVKRFIDKHIAMQGLTAGKAADACGISRRYLYYLMHDYGMSFAEYLWKARLTQATRWLHDKNMSHVSTSEIAYMSGFRSASHFSSAYRTRYGITPREARKNPPLEDSNN